ncbi:MAG: ACT domain-containing protein [Gemmatimonadota bacterium]|nr:ACT domain-containing protein [Gemmatimonadota bacterium]
MPQTLILEPGDYAVLKLPPADPLPAWLPDAPFWTVTRAHDELSIVCATDAVPYGITREDGWRLLRLEGPFAFDQSGILSSVLAPLATAGVGIMAISTFKTDYVLVKDSRLYPAVDALRAAGHTVRDERSPLAPRDVVL